MNGISFSFLKRGYQRGFPGGASGKQLVCQRRRLKRHRFNPWFGKIPWSREMATHSSVAWETPWPEEPGGLQSTASRRVGHDLAIKQQQKDSLALLFCLFFWCPRNFSTSTLWNERAIIYSRDENRGGEKWDGWFKPMSLEQGNYLVSDFCHNQK